MDVEILIKEEISLDDLATTSVRPGPGSLLPGSNCPEGVLDLLPRWSCYL